MLGSSAKLNPSTISYFTRNHQTGSQLLKYPLKDDDKYQGRLSFEVVDEDQYKRELSGDFANIFSTGKALVGGFFSSLFSIEDVNQFQGNSNKDIDPNINFDRDLSTDKSFGKISLYLPQAINIQDAVAYDNNMQLGRIGAGVEEAVSGGASAGEVASGVGSAAAETIRALTGGKVSPEAATIISQNLAKRYGTEGAGAALQLATQMSLNPNTRTLFQSVPIRQFSFTFTLIATSAPESSAIENIIKAFRTEIYPESVGSAGIDYAYRFPRRFLIKATYNNREWPGIKFLPCYLQNFQTVYNPNSMGFHKDGQWSEVQITMSFSESRALRKQDIEAHYRGL